MSLDLTKVATQVTGMISSLKAGRNEQDTRLHYALDTLHARAKDIPGLKHKITASKTTWLVAGLVNGLDERYHAPPPPQNFTVVAADGSQIDVDRHRSTRCFLINTGSSSIQYGSSPGATLDNSPRLYFDDEDLTIRAEGSKNREQPIEGALLNIKRSVDECGELARLAAELPPDSKSLALVDGSLILWSLEAYPEFVTRALLEQGFLHSLEQINSLNKSRQITLGGYISSPRGTDVVNTLRVALCPKEIVDTDRYCSNCTTRECDALAGIRDQDLFRALLGPNERSDIFASQSSTVIKHYGYHQVYFFYFKVDDSEIARIEIPGWVATSDSLLNLAHALISDQCRRGHGYPVALMEAHEKAVVTEADRTAFWQLVESVLARENIAGTGSAKSLSKRTRWI